VRTPPNKRLQLTPNSSIQLVRGTVLAADAVPQRWRSALLGAAEPHVRWADAGRQMSRKEKLGRRLGAVETELRKLLHTALTEQVAGRRSLVFVNEQFNPSDLRESWLDPVAAELLKLSLEAQDLRAQLGHAADEGPAFLYLEACHRGADPSNPHELGPIRLAQELLERLRSS